MFTGIIEAFGVVECIQKGALRLKLPKKWKIPKGGSVAVNGVCLTAGTIKGQTIDCDCMAETLRLTTLGDLKPGEEVNIEKPLTLQTPIGGHLVQGHVDGVGPVIDSKFDGDSLVLTIKVPKHLSVYLLKKGSITVDGVSLTIVEVRDEQFSVSLIPMTQKITTLGRKKAGDQVNLEVDLIAKAVYEYLQRSERG